jgi:hypothetical protein
MIVFYAFSMHFSRWDFFVIFSSKFILFNPLVLVSGYLSFNVESRWRWQNHCFVYNLLWLNHTFACWLPSPFVTWCRHSHCYFKQAISWLLCYFLLLKYMVHHHSQTAFTVLDCCQLFYHKWKNAQAYSEYTRSWQQQFTNSPQF